MAPACTVQQIDDFMSVMMRTAEQMYLQDVRLEAEGSQIHDLDS